ncbi:MAG: hypothetical protein AAGE80_18375 [Pseudomonadota bacterium]
MKSLRTAAAVTLTALALACAPAEEAQLSQDQGEVILLSDGVCSIRPDTLVPNTAIEAEFTTIPLLASGTVEPRIRLRSAAFNLPERFDFFVDGEMLFRGRFIYDRNRGRAIASGASKTSRANQRFGEFRISAAQREQLSNALEGASENLLELRGNRSPIMIAVPPEIAAFFVDPSGVCERLSSQSDTSQ